jgi:glycosyltransferase involved in cell wall biosynthesis
MNNNIINIAYVIDFMHSSDSAIGGTERQLIETINRLDRNKFKPILYCLQEYGKFPEWENILCEKHILNVYSLISFKTIKDIFLFARNLRNNSVNIVHAYYFDSILFSVFSSKLAGISNIISSRRDLGFWHNRMTIILMRICNIFTRYIIVNCKAIVNNLKVMEKVNDKYIKLIYNGISIIDLSENKKYNIREEFQCIDHNDKIVGIVSNYNRNVKRIDVFIRAAAIVVSKIKNVKFIIIGGGRLEKELKLLSYNLGIENVVIFAGTKQNPIKYIINFDVGCLTSDSEGLSNTIIEYMSYGIPVIATDVGGNRELIVDQETGILVPPGDYQAVADAIMKILSDDTNNKMGKNAKIYAESRFKWEDNIKELESVYLSLCNKNEFKGQ